MARGGRVRRVARGLGSRLTGSVRFLVFSCGTTRQGVLLPTPQARIRTRGALRRARHPRSLRTQVRHRPTTFSHRRCSLRDGIPGPCRPDRRSGARRQGTRVPRRAARNAMCGNRGVLLGLRLRLGDLLRHVPRRHAVDHHHSVRLRGLRGGPGRVERPKLRARARIDRPLRAHRFSSNADRARRGDHFLHAGRRAPCRERERVPRLSAHDRRGPLRANGMERIRRRQSPVRPHVTARRWLVAVCARWEGRVHRQLPHRVSCSRTWSRSGA